MSNDRFFNESASSKTYLHRFSDDTDPLPTASINVYDVAAGQSVTDVSVNNPHKAYRALKEAILGLDDWGAENVVWRKKASNIILSRLSFRATEAGAENGFIESSTGYARFDGNVIVGYFSSHVQPFATGSYDLGATSLNWRDLYLSGTAHIGSLSLSYNLISHFIPGSDDVFNLGSGAKSFHYLHVTRIFGSTTLTLSTISNNTMYLDAGSGGVNIVGRDLLTGGNYLKIGDSDKRIAVGNYMGFPMIWGDPENNNDSSLGINYYGYQTGATKFRDLTIYNGKAGVMASFDAVNDKIDLAKKTSMPSAKIGGAEYVKIWTYQHAITGPEQAAGNATIAITAVNLTKVRAVMTCINYVLTSVTGVMAEAATFWSHIEVATSTTCNVAFGAAFSVGDLINITIIEAV